METEIKDLKNTKKQIKVTISEEEMEEYLEKATQELASEMDVEGFRPGNAPREVVANSVGEENLWEQASKFAVEDTYPQVLEENEIFSISQPEVDLVQLAPDNPVIYRAEFHVMPEVDLPDYKQIAQEVVEEQKEGIEVTTEELNDTLDRIRNSRATSRQVEREAQDADQVNVSFTGEVDGEKRIEEEEFDFSLGEGQFTHLEGFEEEIVGMEAGETKEFTISIPDDNPNQELSGKDIEFELELHSVAEKDLPELNDEFAQSLHKDVSSLDELKDKIREGIKSEKETKQEEAIKMEIINQIREQVEVEIPEVLVEREMDNMKTKLERQLQQSGVTYDEYLDQIDKSEEDLKEGWEEKAEENVASSIILHHIGEEENVEVTEEEIANEVEKHFQATPENKKDQSEEDLERLRNYVRDLKKNEKIFDALMEN